VLSLQLRLSGSSSRYGPVAPSGGWWDDKRNDMPPLNPAAARLDERRSAETTPRTRRALSHHPTERQQIHRPNSAAPKDADQAVERTGPRPPTPITPAPLLWERGENYPRPSDPTLGDLLDATPLAEP
jgi:hypothetical protein